MFKSSKQAVLTVLALVMVLGFVSCVAAEPNAAATSPDPALPKGSAEVNAFAINKLIGRGVNIGNALDGPTATEGEWGVTLQEEYFQLIKDAGFNSIRLTIHWPSRASNEPPYTIDPNLFNRVDWAVKNALSRNLVLIINDQNDSEIYRDPNGQKERFFALWKQIAEHYKDYPNTLLFELLNEPQGNLKDAEWNTLLKEAIGVVRRSNPDRMVVIGTANFNRVYQIKTLKLPEDDRNIIVTVHYYLPDEFTHQGAPWSSGSDKWLGRKWTGTEEEKRRVARDFDLVANWAKQNNRPIYLGEFGTYMKADMDSRACWTKCVAEAAVERGFSFTYWQFTSNFAVYDTEKKTWIKPLLDALIPPKQ
jgi:endoglucanase